MGAALAAGVSVATPALAAPICFPAPAPIPWLPGAPTWAESDLYKPLNDPRWGSFALRAFDGDKQQKDTGEGGFRLVRTGNELSVSIQNKADPTPALSDYASFGLYVPGGKAVAVTVKVNPGGRPKYYSHDMTGELTGTDISSYVWNGGVSWTRKFGYPASADAQWLVKRTFGTWTTQPVTDGGAQWGIQFKVNLQALGIEDTTPVKVFIAMHDHMAPTAGADITTPTPNKDLPNPTLIENTNIWSNPEQWQLARTIKEGCVPGVYIENALQIGTTNAPEDKIETDAGLTNRFFAKVKGLETVDGGVGPGDMVARFRYANWGAQPAETIYEDDKNWIQIKNGERVPNGVAPKAMEAAPPLSEFRFDCPTNTSSTVCGGDKPKAEHQCMVVDLQSAPNKNIYFSDASMTRNMRFVGLSRRTLPAEISLKGLRQEFPRDVIVRILTRNMPGPTIFPLFLDSALLNNLKMAVLGLAQIFNPLGLSLTPTDLMKVAWPTYEVHVYYDTGRKAKSNNVEYKVMSPMNSFGYHFSHSGVYYGFTHGFGGTAFKWLDDKGLVQMAERVPANAVLPVSTGVQTQDVPSFVTDLADFACEIFQFACPAD